MSAKRAPAKASKAPAPLPPPVGGWQRLLRDPRLGEAAWVLLPLRAFLAVTFLYAGLSKVFDRNYLDASSPLGVRAQMVNAAHGSPISGLVTVSAQHAVLTGLLIAFGEIAAGLGALCGLFTRAAAGIGMLLSLSFFLTASWQTTPYYFGSDIVFLFAWTPLLIAGDGGVYAVHTLIRRRVRERMRLPAVAGARESAAVSGQVERRTALAGGVLAGAVGVVVAVGGSALALGRRRSSPSGAAPVAGSGAISAGPAPGTGAPAGQAIAKTTDVAVGDAKSFNTANGQPAWLLHPSASSFTAVSAVCTHQGCPVQWAGNGFQCPCHGATYDATGKATGGPARGPLAPIAVTVANGEVHTTS
jgi:thiosulfate dehydrogenase [quinone] large subunit